MKAVHQHVRREHFKKYGHVDSLREADATTTDLDCIECGCVGNMSCGHEPIDNIVGCAAIRVYVLGVYTYGQGDYSEVCPCCQHLKHNSILRWNMPKLITKHTKQLELR